MFATSSFIMNDRGDLGNKAGAALESYVAPQPGYGDYKTIPTLGYLSERIDNAISSNNSARMNAAADEANKAMLSDSNIDHKVEQWAAERDRELAKVRQAVA
jgi:hypothetical protein